MCAFYQEQQGQYCPNMTVTGFQAPGRKKVRGMYRIEASFTILDSFYFTMCVRRPSAVLGYVG